MSDMITCVDCGKRVSFERAEREGWGCSQLTLDWYCEDDLFFHEVW